MVVAGAGYGKTQAVYSFLQKFPALIVWMQISSRDNTEERFWENFATAVGTISKGTAKRLLESGFPSSDRLFDRYLSIPRQDIDPEKRYVFVYDDFHLLENKAVLHFIEHCLSSVFPNLSSILISRQEIGIGVARLEGRRQVARITEGDLRFTEEETAEYFRIQHLSVSPQFISMVNRETEGWAFAVHLATLPLKNIPTFKSGNTGETLYVLPAMRPNVFKLIETEILGNISPELRKFFIALSLTEELPQDLLVTLASHELFGGSPFLLDEIEAKLVKGGIGSFIHYDGYRKAYRIHHLLLDYLGRHQGELNKEEKNRVYFLVADWYSKNGRKMDAIAYYEKAEDFDAIIRELYFFPLLFPQHLSRFLLELLDRVPEELYRKSPLLYVFRSRATIGLAFFDQTEAELKTAIPRLESALDHASGPEKAVLHRAIFCCYMNLGFVALIRSGQTENYDYAWLFKRGAGHGRLSGYVSKPPVSVAVTGFYACRTTSPEREEAEKFIAAIDAFEPYTAEAMGGCYSGTGDLARAELAFFRANFAEAEKYAKETVRKARQAEQYEIENRGLFYLLRIYLSCGDFEELRRVRLELGELRKKPYYLNRFTQYDIVEGWFVMQLGFAERLADWLKNDFEESDLSSLANGLEILIKAKYHFIEKKYPAALAALESRKDMEGSVALGRIETLALIAVCRYGARNQEGAYAALAEAYALARSNSYLMPFTELGRHMRSLADSALRDNVPSIPRDWLLEVRRSASAYAKRIFAARKAFGPASHTHFETYSTLLLSRREQEVLDGLSRGLTRGEIAGSLVISVNTVKSVISSVYSKLGAVNRADAVRIATARGILRMEAGAPDAGSAGQTKPAESLSKK
ncbi:MAG: LuxR C-terminal-related transcriptional regulator [Treponema sp.]|jgi:LuxR family maltose regulon positive regulatory protein|nr:LuxR C-terminal-related transcriptional regulator [Treponema sp.]